MKIGKPNVMTHLLMLLIVVAMISFALSACAKDKDESRNIKNSVITFSVSNTFSKAAGDHFIFGAEGSRDDTTIVDWKLDGRKIAGDVSIDDHYVDGGKSNIIVKSVSPFFRGSVGFTFYNIGKAPYTVTYTIKTNDIIIDQKTIIISSGETYFKSYSL